MTRIPFAPLVKFLCLAVVVALCTTVLALTIANASGGARTTYTARFIDASGLLRGDDVRIAGVAVGTEYGDPDDFGAVPAAYDMGLPNSPGERQVVAELLALQQGTSPEAVPAWSTMLVGPLYRGTEVTVT